MLWLFLMGLWKIFLFQKLQTNQNLLSKITHIFRQSYIEHKSFNTPIRDHFTSEGIDNYYYIFKRDTFFRILLSLILFSNLHHNFVDPFWIVLSSIKYKCDWSTPNCSQTKRQSYKRNFVLKRWKIINKYKFFDTLSC